EHLPYDQTNAFSKIALDYLSGSEDLRPFYSLPPTVKGIEETIQRKKQQAVNRRKLVEVLQDQYQSVSATDEVKKNIESLLSENTFTVCTAHQPNLFTGPLYFVYKVLHTIKLAGFLKEQLPQYHFVPVYYMGSEDADFAELNHTYVDGKKIEWKKEQTGAVGRMIVDSTLIQLINELEGQLLTEANGKEVIDILHRCYSEGKTIQAATFELVNELYGQWGLIVLIPDNPALKAEMMDVFEDDLFNNTSSQIVEKTSENLEKHYQVQANPREINLFYLKDHIRERIEEKDGWYSILNTELSFTKEEIKKELQEHPERFSPNVILRGLFQETILPNLAFIGGGGEMAYWLQLKDLFDHYKVVYPVLVLRNSFLVIEEKWNQRIQKLDLNAADFFKDENELMKIIVTKNSQNKIALNGNFEKAEAFYEQIRIQAEAVDKTLSQYVTAIKTRSLKDLEELEKKMLRAEKRKFEYQQRQIQKIKEALFPNDGLQERVENFSWFYAKWGSRFIEELYRNSLALEQEFTILVEES
ncbi:MAG: bacillithiol biosynthesis cysteine-adding enzyme BshC, partial [Flavisolibacter sp.]|nr:bacillithiol biosynthesis cysteine-adding enzyme BshC [Flavisolibacter sp.]